MCNSHQKFATGSLCFQTHFRDMTTASSRIEIPAKSPFTLTQRVLLP